MSEFKFGDVVALTDAVIANNPTTDSAWRFMLIAVGRGAIWKAWPLVYLTAESGVVNLYAGKLRLVQAAKGEVRA